MDFVGSLAHDVHCCHLGSLAPSFDDEVSDILLGQMGCTARGYQREGRAAARRIVSEVYSPPRVTELLRKLKHRHLTPGFAFDLTVDEKLLDPREARKGTGQVEGTEAVRPHRLTVLQAV